MSYQKIIFILLLSQGLAFRVVETINQQLQQQDKDQNSEEDDQYRQNFADGEYAKETQNAIGIQAFLKYILGVTFIFCSVAVLVITEFNYNTNYKFLRHCQKNIKDSSNSFSKYNQGKLIYKTGSLQMGLPNQLTDPQLPIVQLQNATVLQRNVSMYQWVEAKKQSGCIYYQDWKDQRVNSQNFKDKNGHSNPEWNSTLKEATFEFDCDTYLPPHQITKDIIQQLDNNTKQLPIKPQLLQEKIFGFNVYIDKKFYYLSTHERQEKYYPKIGDYRIQYSYIPMLDSISIVGEQEGNTIKAYKDKVLLVNKGRIPIDTIFEALFSGQKSLQNMYRIGSVFGIVLGVLIISQ